VRDIWLHVAEENPGAADRLLDQIEKAVLMLGRFPEMGRQRDGLRSGLRSFAVGDYVIFYLARNRTVVLVRVLSGFRNLDTMFDS